MTELGNMMPEKPFALLSQMPSFNDDTPTKVMDVPGDHRVVRCMVTHNCVHDNDACLTLILICLSSVSRLSC